MPLNSMFGTFGACSSVYSPNLFVILLFSWFNRTTPYIEVSVHLEGSKSLLIGELLLGFNQIDFYPIIFAIFMAKYYNIVNNITVLVNTM